MEDLIVFDKDGNPIPITDVIRNFLKEHLSIQISVKPEYDYGKNYAIVEVNISLDGELISKDSDSIRINE